MSWLLYLIGSLKKSYMWLSANDVIIIHAQATCSHTRHLPEGICEEKGRRLSA